MLCAPPDRTPPHTEVIGAGRGKCPAASLMIVIALREKRAGDRVCGARPAEFDETFQIQDGVATISLVGDGALG